MLRRDKKILQRFCYSANVAVLREQKWLAALKSCQNHCWLYASGTLLNKCIGDDTKAAARQSLNCIKNKRNSNMAKNDFQYGGWNSYTLQCGVWLWNRDSKFIKWQHPAMWYVVLGWHAIEFAQTSAILEFYIWFRFRPHHRSRHVIVHQSPKFYPNRTTLGRKKWRHVDFQDGGSQPSWILGIQ